MPLLVKEYSWRQTENVVVIRVPLKGVHYRKVDIFTSDNYIKAYFHPFLFEVFLFSSVKEPQSKCTLVDDEIVFELQKVEHASWDDLEANLSKVEQQEMRKKILERAQEKAKAEQERKRVKKAELDRLAVRQQISIDTHHRQLIEEIKENVKKTAIKEIEEWKVSNQREENKDHVDQEVVPFQKTASVNKPTPTVEPDENVKPIPFPRNFGIVKVHFTARDFPTPKRESQAQEEEEWLKKQAEARRRVGFMTEDLSPEELDPVWLKDKGDNFFKVGNYLGAVSAYSHAISIGSKMPALYSNRAAAHMALGNLHKTVEDCSTASQKVPGIPLQMENK
ncbi:dynein assembly factor 4, axonemal isoform X3 [Cryptotermes secundus]|nr:dynein assembly factor 4, axonemal isoform X3 [Cryptotermes secundus]